MAEAAYSRVWLNRATFVLLAFVIIVLQLVPQSMVPDVVVISTPRGTRLAKFAVAGPDVLLAVTLVWIARRPDYLPLSVIAIVFFLADLLFQRPPGLWAALVVILTEALRNRARSIRNMPLLLEWGTVAIGIVAITLGYRLALAIVMTPQAPLVPTLVQMVGTIAIYPLVALIAHFIFGVTRPAPGQLDGRGQRL